MDFQRATIRVKEIDKTMECFVLKDYYGKGCHCYNPVYIGRINGEGDKIGYREEEIEIINIKE